MAVTMPPANMAATASVEPAESCAMPEILCPEVQPPAMRAPNSMMKPARKASGARAASVVVPSRGPTRGR